jgi:hypothetical protein
MAPFGADELSSLFDLVWTSELPMAVQTTVPILSVGSSVRIIGSIAGGSLPFVGERSGVVCCAIVGNAVTPFSFDESADVPGCAVS